MTEKLNLTQLRQVAEAATPGPWETLGGQGPFGTHAVCHRMEQGTLVEIAYRDGHFDKANADHIAAFDPPTVRAYTDTMPNLRALWAQRVKWGTGTLQDLLRIGINRHTWQDWATQAAGAVNVLVIMLTLTLTTLVTVTYGLTIIWWWLALPALIAGLETRKAYRIPHYHWQDIALAASLAPTIFYMGFRAALFLKAWATITTTALTKKQSDLWATQYVAEGK